MSRDHALAPHRVALVGIVLLLGTVAFLALQGPRVVQRAYRPLEHEERIASVAESHDLDPYLVAALVNVESGFEETRVSPRGAVGLMQVMPSTAEEVRDRSEMPSRVTTETLKDPEVNLEYGATYLSRLVERYEGHVPSALAAYNAGPSNADKWRDSASEESSAGAALLESIDYPETRRYIRDVLKQREDYRRLYPHAFRDGGSEGEGGDADRSE